MPDPTAVLKRWSPSEIAAPEFDGKGTACAKRLFILTQPRTASFTLCRYFIALGWGTPTEYFSEPAITSLSPRLLGRPIGRSCSPADLIAYREALEGTRSRNGLFATKVMLPHYSRLRAAYCTGRDLLAEGRHIYLRRRNFGDQVVSFVLQQSTGLYSFSATDAEETPHWNIAGISEEDALERAGHYLIKGEARWLGEFARRGWTPILLETEALLENPRREIARLATGLGLPFDAGRVEAFIPFEQGARYAPQKQQKAALAARHAALLARLSLQRDTLNGSTINGQFNMAAP